MEITGISATPVHIQNTNEVPQTEEKSENEPVSPPNQTVEANREGTLEVGIQIDVTA